MTAQMESKGNKMKILTSIFVSALAVTLTAHGQRATTPSGTQPATPATPAQPGVSPAIPATPAVPGQSEASAGIGVNSSLSGGAATNSSLSGGIRASNQLQFGAATNRFAATNQFAFTNGFGTNLPPTGRTNRFQGLPPGLEKRDELPPGLQRDTLPPGLEKRTNGSAFPPSATP
jgi:hypothetical protein